MESYLDQFLKRQLTMWQLAKTNYEALSAVETKHFEVDGTIYKVQFNPMRSLSSTAKVDKKSIAERPCFLCSKNLPAEQDRLTVDGFLFLVNPYPIFMRHLTIPKDVHTPQSIQENVATFIGFARQMNEYTLLYNGPMCGASAPDHMHFQAIDKEALPFVYQCQEHFGTRLTKHNTASAYIDPQDMRHAILLKSDSRNDLHALFQKIYPLLPTLPNETEPRMNLLSWTNLGKQFLALFPRNKHRPDCYTAQGEKSMLISPGSVDMGGVLIATRKSDFEKIQAEDIRQIFQEVSISKADFLSIVEQIKCKLT